MSTKCAKNRLRNLMSVSIFTFILLLISVNAGAVESISVDGMVVIPDTSLRAVSQPEALFSGDSVANSFQVHLPPISNESLLRTREAEDTGGGRLKIGENRPVNQLMRSEDMARALSWISAPNGGYSASLMVNSEGAEGLRMGISIKHLPANASLRFFSLDAIGAVDKVIRVEGEEIMELINLNLKAEPDNPNARTYWSPSMTGDAVGLEIFIPHDVDPSALDISIPAVSHIFVPLSGSELDLRDPGNAKSCQNDVVCSAAFYPTEIAATAKMTFVDGGTFICTGTVLNDIDETTTIPYFISAAHCLNTQTVASTLVTRWKLQSATCGSTTTRDPLYEVVTGGATLLWQQALGTSNGNLDTVFLRLKNTPTSAGWGLAGWDTSDSDANVFVRGIHHPRGDWKKISWANTDDYYECRSTVPGSFSCNDSNSADAEFIHVDFYNGDTEGGSSGSGLLDPGKRLTGTLTGGSSNDTCTGQSSYARFGVAFSRGNLGRWLYTEHTDLRVINTSVSDNTLRTGQGYTLFATVKNYGGLAANATTLSYRQSSNDIISTSDTELSTDPVVALAPGASQSLSDLETAPATAGTYYVGGCALFVPNEWLRDNNCTTPGVKITVRTAPDLIAKKLYVQDTNPYAGQQIKISAYTENIGDASAPATLLTYYKSVNSTIDSLDTAIGYDKVAGLAAGAQEYNSMVWTTPVARNKFWLGACVKSVYDEKSTKNNCTKGVEVLVTSQPDLIVTNPGTDKAFISEHEHFQAFATVKNQGTKSSTATTMTYRLSTNAIISTSDTEIGNDAVAALVPGATSAETTLVSEIIANGTYWVGACVVAPADEQVTTNNCSSGARLVVCTSDVPAQIVTTALPTIECDTLATAVANPYFQVGPTGSAHFRARDSITLNPGFRVEAYGRFRAEIIGAL